MPTYVEPSVHIIGESQIDWGSVQVYLNGIEPGLGRWADGKMMSGGLTGLTEIMGRLCYKSWAPGINPNVTRVRDDTAAYIRNLVDSEHGSVFEHASISFIFSNVSRVFTHELVRHRVGVAISQESMRYMRLTDIPFWMPDSLSAPGMEEFELDAHLLLERMEAFQRKWSERLNLDESKDFEYKKRMTSALRRWSPQGVATQIGWTCNVRELRHVIPLRTSEGAEEEMRLVIGMLARLVTSRWPMLFGDLEELEDGSWIKRRPIVFS